MENNEMYILLKPNVTDEVIAEFMSVGGVPSDYNPRDDVEKFEERDLISGAALQYFKSPCCCIKVDGKKAEFKVLEYSELIQGKYLAPLAADNIRKLKGLIKIRKLLGDLREASSAIQQASRGLESAYTEITDCESDFYESGFYHTDDYELYYSTENEEISSSIGEFFEEV